MTTTKRTPPDLQKLVEAYGGYHKITPQAWAEFDRKMEEYRDAIRRDVPYHPMK